MPPPKPAPKGAPEFDSVPDVVKTENLFVRVIAFANDAEISHYEPFTTQFPDRPLGGGLVGEDGDGMACRFHLKFFHERDRRT